MLSGFSDRRVPEPGRDVLVAVETENRDRGRRAGSLIEVFVFVAAAVVLWLLLRR